MKGVAVDLKSLRTMHRADALTLAVRAVQRVLDPAAVREWNAAAFAPVNRASQFIIGAADSRDAGSLIASVWEVTPEQAAGDEDALVESIVQDVRGVAALARDADAPSDIYHAIEALACVTAAAAEVFSDVRTSDQNAQALCAAGIEASMRVAAGDRRGERRSDVADAIEAAIERAIDEDIGSIRLDGLIGDLRPADGLWPGDERPPAWDRRRPPRESTEGASDAGE